MKRILSLFIVLFSTIGLWAGNVITYTATEQLQEKTSPIFHGIHMDAFNVSIVSHTFEDGIGTITFSGELTTIGDGAFDSCEKMTSITIPEGVTTIGDYAFDCCYGLTSITLPESVTSIGVAAFASCENMTSFTIPNGVISISEETFYCCFHLTSITIPEGVTSIGENAFHNCSALSSITIPESVTSIDNFAFNGCTGFTSITIPENVTSIGDGAFSNTFGLTTMVVAAGNTHFDSRDNCNAIIETSTNTLLFGCQNTIIPNSVTSIEYLAFESCFNLTSITIPESVTSIGNSAFMRCTGLTSITIPESVTSIDFWAFYGCIGLTSITCESPVPAEASERAFEDIPNDIPVYVPAGSADEYRNATGWSYFSNFVDHNDVEPQGLSNASMVENALAQTYDIMGRKVSANYRGIKISAQGKTMLK